MNFSLSAKSIGLVGLAMTVGGVILLQACSHKNEPISIANKHPKKIFAHYMGCYPIASKSLSTEYLSKTESQLLPDGPSYMDRVGGRWRDYPLTPQNYKPTLEEAMDLEIRRAMRMGLDGFAVDVLAGQQEALDSLDALFKVAEEKDYPFEITFCLDNPKQNLAAVEYLMKNHGKSPKLARRDGKVLFLGYRSYYIGQRLHPDVKKSEWAKPESIKYYGEAIQELEKIAGQPIYAQFDLNGYMEDLPEAKANDPIFWKEAAASFSMHFGGLSGFFWGGKTYDDAAKAARRAGMDWGEPIWAQYQNLYWNTFRLKDGSDLLRERWEQAIANDATLIQIATWNDYTEATNVAPGQQTGYAINDLMGLMIKRWKTGQWPTCSKDRIYFFYPPYPQGSPVYPFHDFAADIGGHLEVVTYLTEPGKIVMPGRNESWEAPAGLFVKKLPPKAGPVTAEIYRKDKKVASLTALEPITALPFRAQHSMVGFSTEDARYWKEDFPQNTESPVAYYGDNDHDGLPNWFEMFYCGKLGDFSLATAVNPDQKVPGTTRTILESYRTQKNPFGPETVPPVGTKWDLLSNPIFATGVSTNPEADSIRHSSWRYMGFTSPGQWRLLPNAGLSPQRDVTQVTYSRESRNFLAPPSEPKPVGKITYVWTKQAESGNSWIRTLTLQPSAVEDVAVEWPSPASGVYQIELETAWEKNGSSRARFELNLIDGNGQRVWTAILDSENSDARTSTAVTLEENQSLRLEAKNLVPSVPGAISLRRFTIQRQPAS
jgi:hypothetical protein